MWFLVFSGGHSETLGCGRARPFFPPVRTVDFVSFSVCGGRYRVAPGEDSLKMRLINQWNQLLLVLLLLVFGFVLVV